MARLNVDGDKSIYFEDLGSGDKALILIHVCGLLPLTIAVAVAPTMTLQI